jgi:GT2 family glycosyltransferase
MRPRVMIIILCYNGVADTIACLRSLKQLDYPRDRLGILVLDNASGDGTPAAVRAAYPDVTVIENGANLGFAAGNNVGLRYALDQGYDYALLLNNDTEAAPDCLSQLIASAEADPQIGAVGPTIYYHAQPDQIWSAGGWIDWRRGTSAMRGIGEADQGQYSTVAEVDFVTGCALLIRRQTMEQAGLLDERFFMYYEDTEWCVRIRRAGFRILHVPAAHLWHKIPLTDRVDKPYVAYYMTRNRLLFLRASGGGRAAWLHAIILQDLRTYLSYTLRPKWRARRASRDAMLRGLRDYICGRWGCAPDPLFVRVWRLRRQTLTDKIVGVASPPPQPHRDVAHH